MREGGNGKDIGSCALLHMKLLHGERILQCVTFLL